MDKLINILEQEAQSPTRPAVIAQGVRRLQECRSFLERFAAGEPPPEGCTYEEWAKELLA